MSLRWSEFRLGETFVFACRSVSGGNMRPSVFVPLQAAQWDQDNIVCGPFCTRVCNMNIFLYLGAPPPHTNSVLGQTVHLLQCPPKWIKKVITIIKSCPLCVCLGEEQRAFGTITSHLNMSSSWSLHPFNIIYPQKLIHLLLLFLPDSKISFQTVLDPRSKNKCIKKNVNKSIIC